MVERSKHQTEKVRSPEMHRCELLQMGEFSTRHKELENVRGEQDE